MNEHEQAAADVLAGFVPIGDDHPRVRDFEAAVVEEIARRPSPKAQPGPTLADIDAKLDKVLTLLRGGAA